MWEIKKKKELCLQFVSAALSHTNPEMWTGRKKTVLPLGNFLNFNLHLFWPGEFQTVLRPIQNTLEVISVWILNPRKQWKGKDENYTKQKSQEHPETKCTWNLFYIWCDFQPQTFFIQLLKYHNHHHHHRLQSHTLKVRNDTHNLEWQRSAAFLNLCGTELTPNALREWFSDWSVHQKSVEGL